MAADTRSTDWSTAYSQFLTRAASLSARTLKLYHEALEHVARGTLPPTVFQDHLPAFARAHAAEYSNRLAGVGSRFLSRLARLAGGAGVEGDEHGNGNGDGSGGGGGGGDGGEPGGPGPEVVPPAFDAANPVRWFEQFAEYAGQLNARALRAYRAQLDRVAAGEVTPGEAQQRSAADAARRMPDYLARSTRLYFDLLDDLNDVRATYEEAYFRGVLARAADGDGGGDEPPATIGLSGVLGGTVTASLAVTNTTARPATIGCHLTDVRRSDGVGPAFAPPVSVFPEAAELGPGGEATIAVSLRLDPDRFDPDVPYAGVLHVTGGDGGGDELRVEVSVRIVATPVESTAPSTHLPA